MEDISTKTGLTYSRRIPERHELPPELTALRCWLPFKYKPKPNGKLGKPPVNPRTGQFSGWSNPDVWLTFDEAKDFAEANGLPGVGVVLSPSEPLAGIDLDECRDPATGELTELAMGIVREADSYTEVSPSGTGIRIFLHGGFGGFAGKDHKLGIELSEDAGFLTATGNHLDELSPFAIEHRDLTDLARRYFPNRGQTTVGGDEAPPPPEFDAVDLESLEISDHARAVIQSGDCEHYAKDRSTALFGLAKDLLRAGLTEQQAASVLCNPEHGISAAALERRGGNLESAMQWMLKYHVADAKRDVDAEPPPFDFSQLIANGIRKAQEREQAKAKAQTFSFTMLGDLIANPRPPVYLVQDYLEADSLAMLYGPPKCGKSFIAIDLVCSLATGTPWHGHPTEQCPVFYICGEGHNGIARRFLAWSITRGVNLTQAPVAISNRAIPITDPKAAAKVAESIEQLAELTGQQPGLIVVDTLARNFGGNENDTERMSQFVANLDGVRRDWNATALVVHHTGKDETRGARGANALLGAVDASYSVTKDELGHACLRAEEMKEAELPSTKTFALPPVTLPLIDAYGRPVTSCCPGLLGFEYQPPERGKKGRGKNQTKALMHLSRLYTEHRANVEASGRDPDEARVLVSDWRNACIDDGIPRNRFSELIQTLADGELIRLESPYVLEI